MNKPALLVPTWSAPASVVAMVTLRTGGVSQKPFESFNLAFHVGDKPSAVSANRESLQQLLPAYMPVQWLQQVHGTNVVRPPRANLLEELEGDSIYLNQPGIAGAVMTADCLPVFFADKQGKSVAVAHAGWRGLVDGVLENTIACFDVAAEQICAWMGPAIGPCHFEVGSEVREQFLDSCANKLQRDAVAAAFLPGLQESKWLADIYALATIRLSAAGISDISGGGSCTVCDTLDYFSYRRDGKTGRMASLIYFNSP